jgi:hypothetical protein
MNIYDVIHLVINMDNADNLDKIFESWCFNTSVISPETKQEMVIQAKEIMNLGETKVYQHIKDSYKLKI